MPAGFAEIERVECLHSLIGKILSDSRCTLTNHELTVASSERGQELPLWIVLMWAWSVGYGAWTTWPAAGDDAVAAMTPDWHMYCIM